MTIERVVMSGTILGQRCQNVLHFSNPDGALSHTAIKDELLSGWVAVVRNLQNHQWQWTDISIQRVSPAGAPADVFPLTLQVGSLDGPAAVSFASGLFSIRTGVAGRHGHGRFYLPGLHGESVDNGAFESGAYADYQTRAAALVARYKSGGTGPITLGVAPRGDPSSFLSMTSIVVRPVLGVQRRRNIGVGG